MSRISELETSVRGLYLSKNPKRDEWADWLWEKHVLVVADTASDLAKKYEADEDLSRAAALLHDIADAVMKRSEPSHETKSLDMAKELLTKHRYTKDEIDLIVNDALKFHSCRNGQRPKTLEGKILATADSLAHLQTDFYVYAAWGLGQEEKSYEEVKSWTLSKIKRDLNEKILFDEERTDARKYYEQIKDIFSR